jgi:predicted Ser/Thr protein kinase
MNFNLDEAALRQWIEDSLKNHSNILAAGYQGQTLLYENNNRKYVIKVPHGRGLLRWFHASMLRHEYQVYKHLADFSGAPACYGLMDRQYLILEFIEGSTIRDRRPLDEAEFLLKLLEFIKSMHLRGIAHMDLKRKDNLLVTVDDNPCILDFGAAVIKKKGFHPFNRFRYRLATQFDYNAWIKHKYHDSHEALTEEDKCLYKVTWIETLAGKIKRTFKKI